MLIEYRLFPIMFVSCSHFFPKGHLCVCVCMWWGNSLRRSSSKVLLKLWETKETFHKLGLGSEILFPRSARDLSLGIYWPHHNIHLLRLAEDLSVGQGIIILRVLSER